MRVITASEASRNFSAVLDEAARGETVVVTRGGRRVAMVVPSEEANGSALLDVLDRWRDTYPADEEFESLVTLGSLDPASELDRDPWRD